MQNSNHNLVDEVIHTTVHNIHPKVEIPLVNEFRMNGTKSAKISNIVPNIKENVMNISHMIAETDKALAFYDYQKKNPTMHRTNNTIEWRYNPDTKEYNSHSFGRNQPDEKYPGSNIFSVLQNRSQSGKKIQKK
jgi:hypothetical protein